MAWLVIKGHVLASAEVAPDHRAKARGLLGTDGIEGVIVLPGCRWVHTIGMRYPIDVAYLSADGTVLKITHMHRHRIGAPVRHACTVVEGELGDFERWGMHVGDAVEIRE